MIGRFIALLMIIIPLGLAAFGVKMSRDALFDIVNPPFPWLWLQLVTGIICIIVGIGFIGGWIVYRDRKRNYNYKTLRQKQKQG
ncbi:MAG: DUF2627 family protein [Tuberibacillus sp.]